jgi:deazaflavin-dependent oxidoreductase (nitroreductase family)
MTLASFEAALERTDELELTTTGRATGKPVSCPVWFVRRGEKLYLVPGDGTDSQWYKNLLKTPAVHLAARGAQYSAIGTPVTDASMFARGNWSGSTISPVWWRDVRTVASVESW